jgi:hypothetical protein
VILLVFLSTTIFKYFIFVILRNDVPLLGLYNVDGRWIKYDNGIMVERFWEGQKEEVLGANPMAMTLFLPVRYCNELTIAISYTLFKPHIFHYAGNVISGLLRHSVTKH